MILKLEYIPNKSIIITADIAVSQSAKIISIIKTGELCFMAPFSVIKNHPNFALLIILNILIVLFYIPSKMMNKNLKTLALFSLLTAWVLLSSTQAATKDSCFVTADSQAWFGGLVITEYKCFDNDVTIPDEIKWNKITEIWESVFKDSVITSVKLPSWLKQISDSAFADNIIEKVQIPEGVEIIWDSAFKNNKLTAVKFPKTLKSIWNEAFAENKLTKIAVPGRLNKVWDGAFCENANEEVIWVSENLEWSFTKACFKQIKASTIENSYEGIETDFSKTIWEDKPVKTDSEEVNEITTALKQLDEELIDDEMMDMDTMDDMDDEFDDEMDEDFEDEDMDNEIEVEELTWDIEEEISDEFEEEDSEDLFADEAKTDIWWFSFSLDDLTSELGWEDAIWMILWMWSVFFIGIWVFYFVYYILSSLFIISKWEVYRKAWKKWWAFLIPVYNTIVYSDIAEMNKWLWIIPWLWIPAFFWLSMLDLGTLVSGGVTWVLWLVSFVLYIVWRFRVAKRFWWSSLASVLYVIFNPIAVYFLWLGKYEYQPRKKEYKIDENKPSDVQKTEMSQPVIAEEQLNNVVEHFVWPEETSTESEQATEINPVEESKDEEINVEESAAAEEEAQQGQPVEETPIVSTENTENSGNYWFNQNATDAFDAWKAMKVDDTEEENNENQTNNEDVTEEVKENETVSDTNQILESHQPVENEEPTEENTETNIDAEESTDWDTNQILDSFDETKTEDNEDSEPVSESNPEPVDEYIPLNDEIVESLEPEESAQSNEEVQDNSKWVEDYAKEKEAQQKAEEENFEIPFEEEKSSDQPSNETSEEEKVEESPTENEQATEEENTEDNFQYPDEPISDLDQLMANNKKNN